MKIKYFADTDTALIEMKERPVEETIEINENLYIDVDKDGNVVSITIEHAKENMNLPEFSYEELREQPKSA
jgi:uncharacterized protein YuzE